MLLKGLKSNVTISMVLLLAVGMILIDLLLCVMTQKDLIKLEQSKAELAFYLIGNRIKQNTPSGRPVLTDKIKKVFNATIQRAGYSNGLIYLSETNGIHSTGQTTHQPEMLKTIAIRSLKANKKLVEYHGTTWGVFWKQKRYMVMAFPLTNFPPDFGAICFELDLQVIYGPLRTNQKLIFGFILLNLLVLTFWGVHRMSKVVVKPLQKLVKRVEAYHEQDDMLFLTEGKDTEFSKLSFALSRMLRQISEDKEALRLTVHNLEQANTELKQAQKEIIRAEKLASMGRLTSGLAHEIGNPVGIVLGYISLLKEKNLSPDEKKGAIHRAEKEMNRIDSIIKQLLNFSRKETGEKKVISIHPMIREITDSLNIRALMAGIEINHRFSAATDTVYADENQLNQVLINLLINAADAISTGPKNESGKITITTSEDEGLKQSGISAKPQCIIIDFKDNGPGILPEHINNIFDPFFTTKSPGMGTGLGLSVCYTIIEAMGGEIYVSSEKGAGTSFSIRLPLFTEKRQINMP